MSFKLSSVQGTVAELETDLESPAMHDREELVIEEVKKAIDHIVTSLGGYLSVSCGGNINPVSGETGDVVDIHIVSLPYPPNTEATPVLETPIQPPEGVSPGEPVTAAEVEATTEPSPVITENPEPTIPQPAQENVPANSLGISGPEVNAPEIPPPAAPAMEPNTTDLSETTGVVSPEINTVA